MTNDVIVVKETPNSEAATIAFVNNSACHLSYTLNAQLFTTLIWRGNEYLNANITSDWRAPCAENKRSVARNIMGKAALCKLAAVIPVENDREMQLISHSGPASRYALGLRFVPNE